jgi:prepilin-type N-terminal cleavage/methylation domain-containing protein
VRAPEGADGFTLIELMIVIAIIAIIAAVAIPNLLASRMSANESAAVATLRNIMSAQSQFQQGARADTDDDGTGEYGGFLELSGGAAGRMPGPLVPPVLSGAFRFLNANGEVSRSGYLFRMYLPGPATPGEGIPEPQAGFVIGMLDPDLAETMWCCYAWPVNYNQSGNRTFMLNQCAGDVLATEDSNYSGTGQCPAADAAFKTAGVITGNAAVGVMGQDGNVWRQIN